MDEKKRYTIQVSGEAYRFAPLDLEALGRFQLIQYMDVSEGVALKAVMKLLEKSLGPEAWDKFSTGLVLGAIPIKDINTTFDKLLKRTMKDAKADAAVSDDD
jgi:hypothetical protein